MSLIETFLACLISALGGHGVTAAIVKLLRWRLNNWAIARSIKPLPDTDTVWWLAMWIGIAERAIVTALTIWAPSAVAVFVGGWVLLKFAGGWGRIKEQDVHTRSVYMIGLLGNVVSFSVAIAVGLVVSPNSLAALSSPMTTK
jgi:hypothetical protein